VLTSLRGSRKTRATAGRANGLDEPGGAKEREHRPEAIHRMKQREVRPGALTIGTINRLERSKRVGSSFRLYPSGKGNGGNGRLALISKEGHAVIHLLDFYPSGSKFPVS